eukprot:TRINITY_DN5474_c0_g1_i1.p1 TRINITY_DN5474_c0_g1~~TRINITY_DN5474_c0_g1_i1.p1  ORF type:complete len:331 (+),score=39.44 TRINITY_DN5474_c0_g1_i1:301-1293(+)
MAFEPIDLSAFIDRPIDRISECSARHKAAADLVDVALRQRGLFVLNTPSSLLEMDDILKLFREGHLFFDQPKESKSTIPSISKAGFIRGYLKFGAESGRKEYFEPKEGFSYGYEWDGLQKPANGLQGANVWPQSETFKSACKHHFDNAVKICTAIVSALAVAQAIDPIDLLRNCDQGDTISLMRLFRYHPSVASRVCLGSSPHTDWGFLTLILQDGTGGLQVQQDGEWIDVPAPAPYSFVVNGGDYLHLLSRGRYHSPVHRVVTPESRRLSFVFFYYPNYDSSMSDASWQAEQDTPDTGYNTLTRVDTDKALSSFGSYIQAKWQGVQTTV